MNLPVNLAKLRDITGDDTSLERELFQVFLESSEECLTFLRGNYGTGGEQEWRRNAHALKGTSYNLGAERLGDLCKCAQDNHAAPVQEKLQMLADIQMEYEQVKHYLRNL